MTEFLLIVPYFCWLGLINLAMFHTIKENL